MNIIAVDCGASFIKAAKICNGAILRCLEEKSPVVHGSEDILAPIQINLLVPIIKDIILDLIEDDEEITLCLSNEMHGFLLAYKNTVPFTDYISWQKEYGNEKLKSGFTAMQEIERIVDRDEILYSGMPLRAGLPSTNLRYLFQKLYLDKERDNLYFYTLGDYIIKCLSGIEPICHPTNAAAIGLFDLRINDWNKKYIKDIGGEKIVFPIIGNEKIVFRLEGKIVNVLPAIGDQQAALLGAGLNKMNMLSFNLGTGAQVSKLVSKLVCSSEYQIRPYFNGKYLVTIPHIPSGRALNVYIRFFIDILDELEVSVDENILWEKLLGLSERSHGSDIVCDMSFFENAITTHTSGGIKNIREFSLTLGNLIYAIFESMAKNFLWAAKTIEAENNRVDTIVFSGGVARKIKLIRDIILKDYPNSNVIIAENETLLGLYYYAVNFKNKIFI